MNSVTDISFKDIEKANKKFTGESSNDTSDWKNIVLIILAIFFIIGIIYLLKEIFANKNTIISKDDNGQKKAVPSEITLEETKIALDKFLNS